jgi:hypothetical protein
MIAKYILGEYLLNSIRNQKSNNTIFRFTEYVVEPKCYFISIELQKKRMLIFLFSECLKQAHSLKNLFKKAIMGTEYAKSNPEAVTVCKEYLKTIKYKRSVENIC